MTVEKQIKALAQQVMELKAMIAQLGPVIVEPTIQQEIDAVRAQGLDIGEYFKAKGKVKN